jgi:soluble calcium-activated nucleotidase 1
MQILLSVFLTFLFSICVSINDTDKINPLQFSGYGEENDDHNAKYGGESVEYNFVVVTDKDEKSVSDDGRYWEAKMKFGKLLRDEKRYEVSWMGEKTIWSNMNAAGRGMELSELVYFNGKLLTCDDRTGIVFEISFESDKVRPLYILSIGRGKSLKLFKCEWMTVVNDKLYVGSYGNEFFYNEVLDKDSQWVFTIDKKGVIETIPWADNYEALREISNTKYPSYLLHEAIVWNPERNEWVIFPRRLSNESYNPPNDSNKGTNAFFIASIDFKSIAMNVIGELDPYKGTSSFKLIPCQNGDILQLKTVEFEQRIETYITVVNIYSRTVLMEDQLFANEKYEGLEFI